MFGKQIYNANSIIDYTKQLAIKTVITSESDQKSKRNFDFALCHLRHVVENTFLKFKCWRSIVTRYFKISIAFRISFFIRYIPLSLLLFNFLLLYAFCKIILFKIIFFYYLQTKSFSLSSTKSFVF